MPKKLRKMNTGTRQYLWRCDQHLKSRVTDDIEERRAIAILVFHSQQAKSCRLQITFETWDDPIMGNPLFTGIPLSHNLLGTVKVNLNQPKFARQILDHVLAKILWDDEQPNRSTTIENGNQILRELGYDVQND